MDLLILLAVTMDVMFAAVACGASGIRIPPLSCAVMACVSSGFVLASALGSGLLFQNLSENLIAWIGCVALVGIGLHQIREGFRTDNTQKVMQADGNGDRMLSPPEAFFLAIPVSIDSLIGGLGIAAHGWLLLWRFAQGFACGYIAVWCGSRAASRVPIRDERLRALLCGALLIALGICKKLG